MTGDAIPIERVRFAREVLSLFTGYLLPPLAITAFVTFGVGVPLGPIWWGIGVVWLLSAYAICRGAWGAFGETSIRLDVGSIAIESRLWFFRRARVVHGSGVECVRVTRTDPEAWGDAARVHLVRARGRDVPLLRDPSCRDALRIAQRVAASLGVDVDDRSGDPPAAPEMPRGRGSCSIEVADHRTVVRVRADEQSKRNARGSGATACLMVGVSIGCVVSAFRPGVALGSAEMWAFLVMAGAFLVIATVLMLEVTRRRKCEACVTFTDQRVEIDGYALLGAYRRSFDTCDLAQVRMTGQEHPRSRKILGGTVRLWVRGERCFVLASYCSRETLECARDALLFALDRHSSAPRVP